MLQQSIDENPRTEVACDTQKIQHLGDSTRSTWASGRTLLNQYQRFPRPCMIPSQRQYPAIEGYKFALAMHRQSQQIRVGGLLRPADLRSKISQRLCKR